MEFTYKGLLKPATILRIGSDEFYNTFVLNFPKSSSRQLLYDAFDDYTHRFSEQITDSFAQWVGGSFTTQKLNPNDIDVLTILPIAILDRYETLFNKAFTSKYPNKQFVDSYFLGVRELNDPKFPLYRSDYVYWLHQFSTSRKDKFGKTHSRGFIELTYNDFEYE